MIRGTVEAAEVGPLHHHGPELFPALDLIFGGGLPVAAALVLGRWRSIRERLGGGSAGSVGESRRPPRSTRRRGPDGSGAT